MSEYENVHHVTEFNNTLKQLAKTFGREKWVIVKYQGNTNMSTYMTTGKRQTIQA